ncbi:hypothetical protein ACWGN9_38390 [Streptomyces sp. NPDC055775]
MINRMVEPDSGRVGSGRVLPTVGTPPPRRRGGGYVIQQAGLIPHTTVLDNIATAGSAADRSYPASGPGRRREPDRS